MLEPALEPPVHVARAQNPRKAGSTGLTKATEDSILSCALDAIWILGEDNRIEYLNPAAAALTGYTADELIGQSIDIILPPEIAKHHAGHIEGYLDRGKESRVLDRIREFNILHKNGETIPIELKAFEIEPDGGHRRFSAFMRDIRDRKKIEAERVVLLDRLERLAWVDELTGLMNRRGFLQEARKLCSYRRRYDIAACIAIIDLDHFKRINDNFGHGTGDDVLRRIAEICRGAVREEDTLGRIGGEEFGVLCPGAGPADARRILDRLRLHVASQPILQSPDEAPIAIEVTVSAGIAVLDGNAPIEESLRRADVALYEARNSGRNRVCVSSLPPVSTD